MGCKANLVRVFFFIYNFATCLLGLVVFTTGVYIRQNSNNWKELVEVGILHSGAHLLIASGVIVAFVGYLGWHGACKRHSWMLVLYVILVSLIIVLEIAAGVYTFMKRGEVESSLTRNVRNGVENVYGEKDDVAVRLTVAVDWFQRKIKCCGAAASTDWKNSSWYQKNTSIPVPTSCCVNETSTCNVNIKAVSEAIYSSGCIEKGLDYVRKRLLAVSGIGLGVAALEIGGIYVAVWLWKTFRREPIGTPPMK